MAAATTITGAMILALVSDDDFSALVSPDKVYYGLEPEEKTLPWALLYTDAPEDLKWLSKKSARVTQRITLRAWAAAATTPGVPNPTAAIMDAARAALNEADLDLDPAKIRVLWIVERSRVLSDESKRSPADLVVVRGEAVYEVAWELNI